MNTKKERYNNDVPLWLRWLFCWGIQESMGRPLYRFKWGEFHWGWGLTLQYSVYHEESHISIHPLFFSMSIKAPMLITQGKTHEDWCAAYGFTWFERSIHFNWRSKCKIFNLPWDWTHVRHSYLWPNGQLHHNAPERGYDPPPDQTKVSYSYTYKLKNGTIQHRTATINGEEREWRWKWFTWLPWPIRVERCINVEFDDEVGERTGSWKGGTIGCGYEWRHGETMLAALRRMEAKRKF